LQAQLPDASGSTLSEVQEQLDDLLQQLQTMQLVASLESQQPELAILLEEQRLLLARRNDVTRRADELAVDARMEGTGIVIASPAAEAEEVGFDLRRAGAVGLVVGLLIAAAVTHMMALRSRTFTNPGQPENVLGTHLLAAVPSFRDEHLRGALPVSTDPSSAAAESFRFLTGSLRSTPMGQGAVYAFVSGQSGDGKTVTAANTALAAARGGSRVLAIDADFGNQHLTTLLSSGEIQIPLSYQTATGLADLAASESAELSDVVRRVSVGDDAGLFLLNKGSGEDWQATSSHRVG
jgi:hypothetical protein